MLASISNAAKGMHPVVKIGLLIGAVALAWYVIKNNQASQEAEAE